MHQLYFLSIFLNGAAGFSFIMGETGDFKINQNSIKISFSGGGFRLLPGILLAITGLLKFFVPMKEEGKKALIIIGDFLPALAGIIAGFIFVFGYYRENSTRFENEGRLDRIGDFFLHNKKIAGYILLAVTLLHFLFPQAPIL